MIMPLSLSLSPCIFQYARIATLYVLLLFISLPWTFNGKCFYGKNKLHGAGMNFLLPFSRGKLPTYWERRADGATHKVTRTTTYWSLISPSTPADVFTSVINFAFTCMPRRNESRKMSRFPIPRISNRVKIRFDAKALQASTLMHLQRFLKTKQHKKVNFFLQLKKVNFFYFAHFCYSFISNSLIMTSFFICIF